MSRRVRVTGFALAVLISLASWLLPGASAVWAQDRNQNQARGDTLYLSLDAALSLALKNNEDVKIALAGLDKAEGRKREAYSAALPYVGFQAGYTRNIQRPVIFFGDPESNQTIQITIGEKNDYMMNLSFQQAVYAFGRIGGAIKIADYYLRSTEAGTEAARRQVRLEVDEAYYQAVLAQQVLTISQQSLEQARRYYNETIQKLNQQVVSRFDSLRAAVEVKNREPDVISAENAIRLSRLNLKRLIGVDRLVPLVLTDELTYEPEDYSLEQAIAEAYQARPDIAAVRLQVQMSEKIHQVTKRSNFPFLALVGNYTLQGQTSDDLFPPRDHFVKSFGVGLSLSFPIFDGLANRGKVKQAQADFNVARYSLIKMEKAVALEIQQLYDLLLAVEENLQSQSATVSMAEEGYRLALVRFQNGLSTALELEDTELALTGSRFNYLNAVYQYVITKERLENAMGH
jgi:outer membrane protein TolC